MANPIANSFISRILPAMYALKDYTYTLPPKLIAQEATHPHHDAHLMILSKETGEIVGESTFWDIGSFMPIDRVLYFNNSRVLRARIRLENHPMEMSDGKKTTLTHGEILFIQKKGEESFEALVRPGKKMKKGAKIFFESGFLKIISETGSGRLISCHGNTIEDIMEKYGELPLPPYIEYSKGKEKDYQTSFAKKDGSVAAPTASLHFTGELLEKLPHKKRFLTLHVGLGTFKGVDTQDIRDYQIHSEVVEVEKTIFGEIMHDKDNKKKIVAIGTTACRSLESLPHLWIRLDPQAKSSFSHEIQTYWNNLCHDIETSSVEDIYMNETYFRFSTRIYIYPGIPFRIVDELITNFHLPESSLLVLVGSFIGKDATLKVYKKAIEKSYRFFSFGDGMYIRENGKKDEEK